MTNVEFIHIRNETDKYKIQYKVETCPGNRPGFIYLRRYVENIGGRKPPEPGHIETVINKIQQIMHSKVRIDLNLKINKKNMLAAGLNG